MSPFYSETPLRACILMRATLAEADELDAARRYFEVIESRSLVNGRLIIPRYALLPYPEELERDVTTLGGQLINTTAEHRYVADMRNWYDDFVEFTPETWFRLEDVPHDEPGAFVLKGATNSRKALWRTHMLAPDRASIMPVACHLMDDTLIGAQGIYVRRFEPFVELGPPGIQDLPLTEEYRTFWYRGRLLASGFYWSDRVDEIDSARVERGRAALLSSDVFNAVGRRLANRIPFVVADFARHVDGRWRLVELNDGSMSGLSCIGPGTLYLALSRALEC